MLCSLCLLVFYKDYGGRRMSLLSDRGKVAAAERAAVVVIIVIPIRTEVPVVASEVVVVVIPIRTEVTIVA